MMVIMLILSAVSTSHKIAKCMCVWLICYSLVRSIVLL